LNWATFKRLTSRPLKPGEAPPPVDLDDLFVSGEGLTCFLYTLDEELEAQPLNKTLTKLRAGDTGGAHRRLMHRSTGMAHANIVDKLSHAERMMHGGKEVCTQRWSVARWFVPSSQALWFCYFPEEQQNNCSAMFEDFNSQGSIFICTAVVLLALLAHVMRGQTHFAVVIEGMARVALNLELAIWGMVYLVDNGFEADRSRRALMVFIVVILGSNLAIVPYQLARRCQACETLSLLYLLIIVYSPSIFLDRMTFYKSFRVMMSSQPIFLGIMGVMVEVIRKWLFATYCSSAVADDDRYEKSRYTPMYTQQSSYRVDTGF